jgi:acetyltransferase-like isoleucine patch superfamily enzyme
MQKTVILVVKLLKLTRSKIRHPFDFLICYFIFYSNGVKFSTFKNIGWPKVNVGMGGTCIIAKNFRLNNREMSNPIGRFNRCSIIVGKKGELIIGCNVGMSSTAIVCHDRIEIGDNVNIGGNVVIYDTDFHSLNAQDRSIRSLDIEKTKTRPVKIGDNVFIGAHSTILKGVSIGANSIVGACSLVSQSIPDNEIWGGNPAKKIRDVQ